MGDYENHINRKFFQNLICCDCPVVEMGGDKFLLTIPTKLAYIDMETSIGWEHEKLQTMKKKKFPLFDLRYGNLFIFDTEQIREGSLPLANGDITGIKPQDWGRISTKEYDMFLSLIPLDREGHIDTTFAKNIPTGEFIRAGHLLLANGEEMEKGSTRYYSHEDGAIQLAENTDKEPLTWVSAGGTLICTDPIARVRFSELWATKLCPWLARELPKDGQDEEPRVQQPQRQAPAITLQGPCQATVLPGGILSVTPPGNTQLNQLLNDIFQQQADEANDFPDGSLVSFKVSALELAEHLKKSLKLSPHEAAEAATQFMSNPATVIGTSELWDNGSIVSYVTVMSTDGTTYPFPASMLTCLTSESAYI